MPVHESVFRIFHMGQIKGLQMHFKPFIPLFDRAQVRERGGEFSFGRRVGENLQQKACDGIVRSDQHSISAARGFEDEPRGESEWVEQPA
jgi:hypothetical protein